MGREGQKGSITVFLSLICILFLSLICTAVESARVQGAKTQTANITGMGNYSLLGEFERELLEEYDIFSLDGSYGTGSFQIQKAVGKLEDFLSYNADPKKDIFSVWCFDPWNLELADASVKQYALLTDGKGEAFYQQAVAYMRTNAAFLATDKLLDYARDTEQIKNWQQEYEKRQKENDTSLEELEETRKEKLEELESEALENGVETEAQAEISNPLKEIGKLRKKSLLDLVTGERELSGKKIKVSGLPSRKVSRKGTMELEKEYGGLTDNVLFREYLTLHFSDYLRSDGGGVLDYELEYILGGKESDKKNLKQVVTKLLLIREGMNYLYCAQDYQMELEAGKLALALTGFLGIPALTTATKHGLLLAWAYGESLVDLRTLLEGGKVPVFKDSGSWTLTLENLSRLSEILRQGKNGSQSGLTYGEYLRILLNMGNISQQKMRALDLIQCNLRQKEGCGKFKAENCIVGIRTETRWRIKPVFFSVAQAFLGVRGGSVEVTQAGSMAY